MDRTIVTSATCTSCGCLCDDIDLHIENGRIVRAERACTLGREWFFGHHRHRDVTVLVDGGPAALDDAIEAAADILANAKFEVGFGRGKVSIDPV